MLTITKVNAKTLRAVTHARRDLSNRTVCGKVITFRDEALSSKTWEPQRTVTCETCKDYIHAERQLTAEKEYRAQVLHE
jgi:hypothetical protein